MILRQAVAALSFPHAFGLTARYAMKACPNGSILRLITETGMHIDASSGYEVERALKNGIEATRISLSTQELPENFAELISLGISVNACSLRQLERIGAAFPGSKIGLRLNPGFGSGGTTKTNVGGPAASFGIWFEQLSTADEIITRSNLTVFRIHTHIGSGSDPAVWLQVAETSMSYVERYPTVTNLNLGGGYKVARMPTEKETDLQVIGAPVKSLFEAFATRTGRKIHLEIEPGTFMMANAGAILSTIQDVTATGQLGYNFLKLDTGMTELCRPSLYGAVHPITVISTHLDSTTAAKLTSTYVAVGHCCESGDMLTPAPGNPDTLDPRVLPMATIGDMVIIGGAGAYASSMSTVNYNSFPQAPEVLLEKETGVLRVIRKRQTLDQILQNECI